MPPPLFLPGLLCTAELWQHQTRHLVTPPQVADLTGGETVVEVAKQVLAVAPERFALVGFSLGAVVAFELLRQAPERVTRLALVSANARGSTPENLASWREWATMTKAGRFEEVLAALAAWLHPHHRDDAALVTTLAQMGRCVGEAAFLRQLETLASRVDSRDTLATIRCPTLLLVGRHDLATPVALHEEMAALLPQARLAVIEKSGHYLPLEQPEAVTTLLRDWLSAP